MLQRSQSGVSPGRTSFNDVPGLQAPVDSLQPHGLTPAATTSAQALTRAKSSTTGSRPSLTLTLDPKSTPYPSRTPRSPEESPGAAAIGGAPPPHARARTLGSEPVAAAAQWQNGKPQQQQQEQQQYSGDGNGSGGGLPITPRSISKIVSLNDLRQLVRRMEEAPPAPPSPVSVLPAQNDSRDDVLPGNGNGNPNGSGNGDGWSDGVLKVVDVLGEGASGAVETVEDGRNGRRYARKTIVTHEGPLKQLVRELAFLSGLRHAHVVRFHGAYMSPSNSEVKLVMELCEGRSLTAVGEQIRRRKGRVGEKVARVLAEGVCALFLFFSPSLPRSPPFFPPPLFPAFHVLTSFIYGTLGPARSCVFAFQEGYPQRHQALEHPPLATGRSQALRLWRFRRAHRLACGHFHGDDQIHGGARYIAPKSHRAICTLIMITFSPLSPPPAGTHHGKGIHHLRGRLVDGSFHPRARSKPFPVPERSRACGPHHAHHGQRGKANHLGHRICDLRAVHVRVMLMISILPRCSHRNWKTSPTSTPRGATP